MREVGVFEEAAHLGDVPGQKQVVVAEVADDRATRLLQHLVTKALAVPLALGEVEEPHACVGRELLDRPPRVVLHAVSDDEDLEGDRPLCERAPDGRGEERGVVVRRDEDRRVDRQPWSAVRNGTG